MKIEVEVLVTVGNEVLVQNYRTKDNRYEAGVITRVEVSVNSEWQTRVGYDVRLHRKSYPRNGRRELGNPIILYVLQDKIQMVK